MSPASKLDEYIKIMRVLFALQATKFMFQKDETMKELKLMHEENKKNNA